LSVVRTALISLIFLGTTNRAQAETPAAQAPNAAATPQESPVRADSRITGFIATPFGGNTGNAGIGFGLGVNVGLQRIPITLGVDVLTAYWGNSNSRILVRAGDALVPVDRKREDISYFLNTSLRVQPVYWRVRPYLEGFVGTKLLQTRYSLSFPNTGTSTSTVSDHDWAGSVGWGAGIDIGSIASGSLNFTMGFRRLSGAEASFSRAVDAAGDEIVRYASPTSCMIYMLGLMGSFGVAGSASSVTP
jgi:hypothetical protein